MGGKSGGGEQESTQQVIPWSGAQPHLTTHGQYGWAADAARVVQDTTQVRPSLVEIP